PEEGDWIMDPSTQEPAGSRLDEEELRQVAADLDIPYQHRFEASSMQGLIDGINIDQASDDGRKGAVVYRGLYRILALALGGLLAWEGWDVLRQLPSRRGTSRGDPDALALGPRTTDTESS